jgi:tetratricopeptide (TPR) repeat protein
MAEQESDLALEAAQLGIPEGVREVIGHRLSRLSEDCNRTLSIASVVGREFDLDVLDRVSDLSSDRLLTAIEEAEAARVVAETPGAVGRYHFVHALIRETLHEGLSAVRRARMHKQIGEVLEAVHGSDVAPHFSELAYHFFEAARAGDAGKAVDYAMRAGEWAIGQLAYEQAANNFDMALQALDLTGETDGLQRCEILLARADAQRRAGDGVPAGETFRSAADQARRLGAPDLLARAVLGLAGNWVTGGIVDEGLVARLQEAAQALGQRDSSLKVRVLARLAVELRFSPARAEREATSQQAVEMARRLGDVATLAAALDARQIALWGPHDIDARLAAATEVLDLAHRVGDQELALTGHRWRLRDLLELGKIEDVDAEIETYGRIAEDLRQAQYIWYTKEFRAMRALLAGRFEEAEQLAREGLGIGQRLQHLNALQWFGVQMATLRRDQGRVDELESAIAGFVQQFPGVRWLAAVAAVYMELGREEDAREEFERLAAEDFADLPQDWNWLIAVSLLAEVCAYLRDAERAKTLYELLLPYARRCVVAGPALACYGSASRYLGLLARTLGREDEAERHFQDALELNAQLGAAPWEARTKQEYAELLLGRRRDGDREQAQVLLKEALEAAERLSMSGLAGKTRALVESLPATR